MKLSILSTVRWILSDDLRTARAIRLVIGTGWVILLTGYAIALVGDAYDHSWPIGALTAGSGGLYLVAKRRHRRCSGHCVRPRQLR